MEVGVGEQRGVGGESSVGLTRCARSARRGKEHLLEKMTPSSEKIRRRRKDSESEGKEGEFGYGAHLTRKSGEGCPTGEGTSIGEEIYGSAERMAWLGKGDTSHTSPRKNYLQPISETGDIRVRGTSVASEWTRLQ